ncbi:MAG: alpha/beta fold hydrolase [Candidatus Limnocylindria bacterium]
MRRLLPCALLLALAGCAGGLTLADGSGARLWGDGPYGLVLVHDRGRDAASWDQAARAFADEGMTVLAVEDATGDAVVAAISHLQDGGLERVALLGAGEGATVAMDVGRERPELVDQLIALSAAGDAAGLGAFPKLFVASAGEAAASDAERLAAEAPGDWNALYLAPGTASGQEILLGEGGPATLDAILRRLDERR